MTFKFLNKVEEIKVKSIEKSSNNSSLFVLVNLLCIYALRRAACTAYHSIDHDQILVKFNILIKYDKDLNPLI